MHDSDQETFAVIGAAIEVHKELGCGFLEPVYQEAMAHELSHRSIPFQREVPLNIKYKGTLLKTGYRADFVCFNSTIVELKALTNLSGNEAAQVLNYLKAAKLKKALLINFGERSLRYKRFMN